MAKECNIIINNKEYNLVHDELPYYDPEEVVYGKLSGRNYLNIDMPSNSHIDFVIFVMFLIKKGYFDIVDPVNDLTHDDFYFSKKIQRYVCNYNDHEEFFDITRSKGVIYNLGPKEHSIFWVIPKASMIINKNIVKAKALFQIALPEVTEEFREETLDFITTLEKNTDSTTINKIIHNDA